MPHLAELPSGVLLRVNNDDFWVWRHVEPDFQNNTYWLYDNLVLEDMETIIFLGAFKALPDSSVKIGRFLSKHGIVFTYLSKILLCSFES